MLTKNELKLFAILCLSEVIFPFMSNLEEEREGFFLFITSFRIRQEFFKLFWLSLNNLL